MGHLVFIVLHIFAMAIAGLALLFITIPAHLIYAAVKSRKPPATLAGEVPSPKTHVRCPDCKELVRRDASKCKHCGTELTPQPMD